MPMATVALGEGAGGYLTMLAGRAPRDAGEIALGAQTMRALGLRVGQSVRVTANHEYPGMADKTTKPGPGSAAQRSRLAPQTDAALRLTGDRTLLNQ